MADCWWYGLSLRSFSQGYGATVMRHSTVGSWCRWHIEKDKISNLCIFCTSSTYRPIHDVKLNRREASLCTCWNYKQRLLRFVLGTSESGSSRVYSQGNATMNACCVWIYMSPLWAYYIYTRRDSCLLSYCNMLARAKMCGIVTSYPAFLCQS